MRIPAPAFTTRDVRYLELVFGDILDCIDSDGACDNLHEYDQIVMTSQGHVEVQHDGCVIHFGYIVLNLDGDAGGDDII